MPITPLPTPPSRAVPATFSTLADAFLSALPTFQSEANALADDVDVDAATASTQAGIATDKAGEASASAVAALASKNSASGFVTDAAAAAGATVWVSGTTYAIGNARFSPVNFLTYRRKTAGAGTVDPSLDATNWVPMVLPSQTGNAGKFVTTDGASASWAEVPPPLIDIAYDDRAQLRSMTDINPSVVVDGIGLFRHLTGSIEPDDDETCFATSTGRWLLQCPHNDYITDQLLGGSNSILYASAPNTLLTVGTVAVVTQTVNVVGASTTDAVVVSPPAIMDGKLSVYGYVSANGTVSICVQNASATTSAAVPTGMWRLAIIPTIGY